MVQCVRFYETGGPEVLKIENADPGQPGPGEVRLRQRLAGVNFADIYHRTGLYPVPSLPAVPGVEAIGVVESVGDGVQSVVPGQRVAWAGLPIGGYAQARLLPAGRVLTIPDALPDEALAGTMLRGITAYMLLHKIWPVRRGHRILVTAAAGGLGLLLSRWASLLGAEVTGVVGSEAKGELARAAGASHVIVHSKADVRDAVRKLTDGRRMDAVFDGVGGDLLRTCLDCVRPFGLLVSLGQASGWLPEISLDDIGPKRSIAVARPSVFGYSMDEEAYRTSATAYFEFLARDPVPSERNVLPLEHAADAHRALEAGRTTGTLLLDLS